MKLFVIAAICIAAVRGGLVQAPQGQSTVSRSQDAAGNYNFAYNEQHSTGGSFRSEQGTPWQQVGSYGLNDADGRQRRVDYVADEHGFRATINTNEPGTKSDSPAAVLLNAPKVLSAAVASHAPIVQAAPIAFAQKSFLQAPIVQAAPIAYAQKSFLQAPIVQAAPIAYAQKSFVQAPIQFAAAAAPLPAVSYSTSISHAVPIQTQILQAPQQLLAQGAY